MKTNPTIGVLGFVPGLRDAGVAIAFVRGTPDSRAQIVTTVSWSPEMDDDTPEGDALAAFERLLAEIRGSSATPIIQTVHEQTPYKQRGSEERPARVRARQIGLVQAAFPQILHRPIPAWIWRTRFHLSRGSSPALAQKRIEAELRATFGSVNEAMACAMAVWAAEDVLIRAMMPSAKQEGSNEEG